MKLIFRSIKKYKWAIALAIFLKLVGTMAELTLPYILEHMIDDIVPLGDLKQVILWGALMFVAALLCRQFNVMANRKAVFNAHRVSYDVRQALFVKTVNLSGSQFDEFGLPSLISRMTSDSYNVQTAVQQIQSLCFTVVQQKLDSVVRIMRENITGIRVVKALSKEEYEMRRFAGANKAMADSDIKASTIMSIPWPFMQLCLNTGLALVIIFGARRVNAGLTQPGVILAFLTYFNMITMGIMGLNRIFMSMSKASASANRIDQVLQAETDQKIIPEAEALKPAGDEQIRFEHVHFNYNTIDEQHFTGGQHEKALEDIDFAIKKGESLGIIGPTGCGKTTIINLLMRFYDANEGGVFVDGRDVRTYDKDELRRKFGTVFQNDIVFKDTLYENIDFGRGLPEEVILGAVEDAKAKEYVDSLDEGLQYEATIRGANLSGGQKQRLLVARALAGHPEILVLDDSSSALDYKTDAAMRKSITEHHAGTTLIMIAQRVSSVMNMTNILVMDDGRCIGYGSHEELLENCPAYKEIYDIQMGSIGQ